MQARGGDELAAVSRVGQGLIVGLGPDTLGRQFGGQPVGATGLRMVYEVYNLLPGRAGERQRAKVDFGLTHNLGGTPFNSVAAVAILGRLN